MRWEERAVHYPLAMLLLALMDQRACKELEEPGTVQQNKTDREEEDRGLADGDGGKRAGKGKEEEWGGDMEERVMGVMALWVSPAGPTWEEAVEGSAIGGAGGQVYRTDCIEKNDKTDVMFMIVLIISVTLKSCYSFWANWVFTSLIPEQVRTSWS